MPSDGISSTWQNRKGCQAGPQTDCGAYGQAGLKTARGRRCAADNGNAKTATELGGNISYRGPRRGLIGGCGGENRVH